MIRIMTRLFLGSPRTILNLFDVTFYDNPDGNTFVIKYEIRVI